MRHLRMQILSTSRRQVLRGATAMGLAAQTACGAPAARVERSPAGTTFAAYPFALGVASGSPQSDSVVLWTRLSVDPLAIDGLGPFSWPVRWMLADDEAFSRIVRQGHVMARPDEAHSIHVQVQGLQPDRGYWYRFIVGEGTQTATSPVGRTRTAPAAGAAAGSLRFAFASCQQFEQGWYSAYRHMLRDSPSLVIFLGDYIYESSWGVRRVRQHGRGEPYTLPEYRARHALYRSDADLQRMHAAAPWLVTWDDHEVDNDYANAQSQDLARNFLERRAAAYQAYWEHMPLPPSAKPQGSAMQLYGDWSFGSLACFYMLDDRQYRDVQACPRPGRGGSNTVSACESLTDPRRTLLGWQQEQWLEQAFNRSAARWNIVAQQTLFSRADAGDASGERYWTDGWDGYPAARRRLTDAMMRSQLRNPVIIGGDVHANWVCDVKADFWRPDSLVVATEFCGTSITSQGRAQAALDAQMARNPHVRFADATRRGYVLVELNAQRWQTELRVLDDVTDPGSAIRTQARFIVEAGRAGASKG
jgi:alkaline phosphatase D